MRHIGGIVLLCVLLFVDCAVVPGFANLRKSLDFKVGGGAVDDGVGTFEHVDSDTHGSYKLPELGFPYEALESSFIGAQTMHLHHDKHHAFYVAMLNKALQDGGVEEPPEDIEELVSHLSKVPSGVRALVRNHGGGHLNHLMFWKWMKPSAAGRQPQGPLADQISKDFGSFAAFQSAFEKAAATRFGSGWAWLVLAPSGKLEACSTANQDNPVMDADIGDCRGTPILGLDVWEHAYYLDYFNVRLSYVKAFWDVVNWEEAGARFAEARVRAERSRASGRHDSLVCVASLLLLQLFSLL